MKFTNRVGVTFIPAVQDVSAYAAAC